MVSLIKNYEVISSEQHIHPISSEKHPIINNIVIIQCYLYLGKNFDSLKSCTMSKSLSQFHFTLSPSRDIEKREVCSVFWLKIPHILR